MLPNLWKVEGQSLEMDKEYLRGIPEFRVILERRMIVKDDHDGRKKYGNWQIFLYIEIIASLFSFVNKGGYNEKDAHAAAVREARLAADYKPDKDVKAAIVKFRELQLIMLPTLNSINTVLRSLKVSDTVCLSIIGNMEDKLEMLNKSQVANLDKKDIRNIADEQIIIDSLVKQLSNVHTIAKNIPSTINTLEELKERLKKESSGDNLGRGGRTIGNRAEPKRS